MTSIRSQAEERWLGHGSRAVRQRPLAIPGDRHHGDAPRRFPHCPFGRENDVWGLEYRKAQTWQAQTTLLLTQPGFPEGRALFPNSETQGERSKYSYSDPSRFVSLTGLYSQFAQSDEVRALVRREGAPRGSTVSAAPVDAARVPTPCCPSSHCLAQLNRVVMQSRRLGSEREAFMQFLDRKTREAEIPKSQRVQVDVLAQPRGAVVDRAAKEDAANRRLPYRNHRHGGPCVRAREPAVASPARPRRRAR